MTWALGGAVVAQPATLAADHPDQYVVRKGDTLWDISGRFLQQPWQWPELWERNPQIDNPHLIYPGDVVSLVYRDGRPMLTVRRGGGGRPVVRLGPEVRSEPRETGIPAIPLDAIGAFLNASTVVTDETLAAAPYVVSVGKEHLIGSPHSNIYVRGVGEGDTRFAVYRRGRAYTDADGPGGGEYLGHEALHVADVEVVRDGDPATARVLRSNRELLAGDRLLPLAEDHFTEPFVPHAPDGEVRGSIISVFDGVTQIGPNQVVVLNVGENQGIESGHVLAVWQKGPLVEDRFVEQPDRRTASYEESNGGVAADMGEFFNRISDAVGSIRKEQAPLVALPDERAGLVMVFRTFERVSYALVMEAGRAMHLYDRVTNP
ncbi:MAG: LysM domain-containing protein [Gammaproteobacteria bacterium]|nr:LysM domain-containing protein [Gammaproteobacteria bacterium]